MPLNSLIDAIGLAADSAFGERGWQLFIASDAPAVKRHVAHRLGPRTATGATMVTVGRIGHNYARGKMKRSAEENMEISVNALADLILLSEAALLVQSSSKFPDAAHARAQCDQRRVKLPGFPRHALADITQIVSGG